MASLSPPLPPPPRPSSSSSSRPYSSYSHHLSYQIYGDDYDHSLLRENLMREGTFDITFRVYRHGHRPSSNNFELQFTVNIPYQALHQYDLTSDLMRHIHRYDLSHVEIQELAPHIMSRLQSLLQDHSNHNSQLLPSIVNNIHVLSTGPRKNITDSEETVNRVVEESMRRVHMIPAVMEKAMASLEKVEVFSGEAKAERCSICMEDFEEDDDDVSRMPCEHIYHEHCIVMWLKISHMCPLCRFKMPVS